MTKRLTRIAPLQLGKILGVLYALGVLIFMPFAVMFGVIGSIASESADAPSAGMLFGMGLAFMLLMPIFYGVMGFLTGLIGAFIYNLIATWIGGIEFELE